MTVSQEGSMAVRLPWQGEQWQRISDLHAAGTLPHALLLAGAPGVGKQRFARSLAEYLMCQNPKGGLACGECRQCGFNLAGMHPDLKVLAPEEKGKQIKVDQVRAVVNFLTHTSQQGGYKVNIVQPAEAMNNNAANALLKSLEEPAANTLLILITDSPSQLLPTIRSRCQVMRFPVPARDQSLQWLSGLIPSQAMAADLLSEAAGQPVTALDMLEDDGLSRRQQMSREFIAMLTGGLSALALAEKWLDYDLADALVWLHRQLGALVSHELAATELSADWNKVAGRANVQELFLLLDTLGLLQDKLNRGANPNRQLALEALFLETCEKFHT